MNDDLKPKHEVFEDPELAAIQKTRKNTTPTDSSDQDKSESINPENNLRLKL